MTIKRFLITTAGAFALGAAGMAGFTSFGAVAAQAAAVRTQSAKFAIANMTCATCPITVNKAMRGVKGVRSVDINFAAKTATVQFDSAQTNPAQIAAASTNAGYPAKAAR